MRKAIIPALFVLAASLPVGAAFADEKKVKEKRVVRVVAAPDIEFETGDDFVFVGDGDHKVHLGAFGFRRGGYIGVQLVELTPELRLHFGVPEDAGVMVSAVSEEGPAAAAGVQVGDIITAVDSTEVGSAGEIARLVRAAEEGELANLEVWRDGKVMTLTATIAERERPQVDIGQYLWKSKEGEDPLLFTVPPDLPENIIRIDGKHMHKALGDLYTHFDSPEFRAKVKAMTLEREDMEEQIQKLEARLRELEEKLSKLDD